MTFRGESSNHPKRQIWRSHHYYVVCKLQATTADVSTQRRTGGLRTGWRSRACKL